MKKYLLLLISFFLLSCASMQTKRENYVSSHPELDAHQSDAILRGDVIEGMTHEMVSASWGRPVRTAKEVVPGKDIIIWFYKIPSNEFMNHYNVRFVNGQVRTVKLSNKVRLRNPPKQIHHYHRLPPPRPRR